MGDTGTPGEPQVNEKNFLELLESSNFADAEVTCGGKTWKIHRAIVCSRSKWMKSALAGGFKEAQEGKVTIEEHDAESIGLALEHIYVGGKLDLVSKAGEKPFLVFCVKLAKTADYLMLDVLKASAEAAISDHCDQKLKTLYMETGEPVAIAVLTALQDDLAKALLHSIDANLANIQKILKEFLWVARSLLMRGSFSIVPSLLSTVPEVVTDILDNYASNDWRDTAIWALNKGKHISYPSDYCQRCGNKCIKPGMKGQIPNPFALEITDWKAKFTWCVSCSSQNTVPWR